LTFLTSNIGHTDNIGDVFLLEIVDPVRNVHFPSIFD